MDGHHTSPTTSDNSVEGNVAAGDEIGWTPLHHAATMLVDNKKPKATTKDDGNLTSMQTWLDEIKNQIADGDDYNKSDPNGISLIMKLAKEEMWEHCRLLIEMGANVSSLSEDQKYCLLRHVTKSSVLEICKDTDAKSQSVLYNTIRLNNTDLFKFIVEKLGKEYLQDIQVLNRIDEILSEAYEDLLFKGVPLSHEMQFVIEDRLLNSRFCTRLNEETKKDVLASVDAVKARAKLICNIIQLIKDRYSNPDMEDRMVGEFVYQVRFIAENIHILKRQMKSTYDKLPWEEVEFCIANFISSRIRPQEFNAVVFIVLDKGKMLQHMSNFSEALSQEMLSIEVDDLKRKLPNTNRNDCMASVTSTYPCFGELYEDHEKIRTVFSLKRIETYIQLALQVDLKSGNKDVGKLVIERALQVIGECLKSTLESPNVPDSVHKLLLSSAPRNLRQIITNLRDSLSHAHTLHKKTALEESKDADFFLKIGNDLRKIAIEIGYILYEMKLDAIGMLLRKVIDCSDMEEFTKLTKILDKVNFGEIKLEVDNTIEMDKISGLVHRLRSEIMNQTEEEIGWFNEIDEIVAKQVSKLKDAKRKYKNYIAAANQYLHPNYELKTVKNMARSFLNVREAKKFTNCDIMPLLIGIYKNRPDNVKLTNTFYILHCCFEYDRIRIKTINEFREMLEKNESRNRNLEEMTAVEVLEKSFKDITQELEGEDKTGVEQDWESKKELHHLMVKLSSYLARAEDDDSLRDQCEELFAKCKLKKATAKKFNDPFSKKDFVTCKKFVDGIRDEYQILVNTAKKAIANDSPQDMHKSLLPLVKSKVKNFIMPANLNTEPLENHFQNRLKILKSLIGPDTDKLQFIKNYKADRSLQVAVEMLVLDLTEILGNLSLFADNRLFLDRSSPILIGKCLRNYLAHGDCLVDTLPFNTSLSVISCAFRLIEEGEEIVAKRNSLIGLKIHDDLYFAEPYLTSRHSRLLRSTVQQQALYIAAQEGDLDSVKECIEKGGDIKARNSHGWTGLHFAASGRGTQELLQYFLDSSFNVDCKDFNCDKMFRIAVLYGNHNFAEYLIDEKKLRHVDHDGKSLLHLAAYKSHTNIVTLLLSKNIIDVNSTDKTNKTALHYAALRGNREIAVMLLENGAEVDGSRDSNATPLCFAALNGHTDVVEELLRRRASVDPLNDPSFTPLHFAALNGSKDVAVALIASGSVINGPPGKLMTPLWLAIDNGHVDLVQTLLQEGAKVDNSDDDDSMTYLHYAAEQGHAEIASLLLQKEAKMDARSRDDNRTPLFDAARHGHCDVIETLLRNGAMVNDTMIDIMTPLHLAAQGGHHRACAILIKERARVDSEDINGFTPLHLASRNGHYGVVEILLANRATVNALNVEHRTPLHYAARNGNSEVISLLVRKGAEVDARTEGNVTALHVAALNGHLGAVKTLLKNGAEVNAQTTDKITPLHGAAGGGHEDIVRLLLEYKAWVDPPNVGGVTPLHHAAETGQVSVIRLLANKGASINPLTEDGPCPLRVATENGHGQVVSALLGRGASITSCQHWLLNTAAKNGYKDIVEMLLQKGALVNNDERRDTMNPLFLASVNGHADVVQLLLNIGANINLRSFNTDSTALDLAVIHDHVDVVLVLLHRGCDVNAEDGSGHTVLFRAAEKGIDEIILALLKHGANVNKALGNGLTALHYAALNGHIEACRSLLQNGAFVNAIATDGTTALHHAAARNHAGVVTALLEAKADINMKDKKLLTPLHLAAAKGSRQVVCVLRDRAPGLEVDARDAKGMTPLHYAAKEGYEDVTSELLLARADINSVFGGGNTPLHAASLAGHAGVAQILLAGGAEIDAKGSGGCTPLHIATGEGHAGVVQVLLAAGVMVDAKDKDDITAIHYAAKSNRDKLVEVLLSHGATINARTNVGLTPLHFAAGMGCLEALNALLLDEEANVNAQDVDNFTPLHMAVISGQADCLVPLLKHGANIEAIGMDNMTALHIAADKGHRGIVGVLIERGANLKAVTSDNRTPFQLAVASGHWNVAVDLNLFEKLVELC